MAMGPRERNNPAFPVWAAWLVALAALLAAAPAAGQGAGELVRWRKRDMLGADDFRARRVTAVRQLGERAWIGTDRGVAWSDDGGRAWMWFDLSRVPYAEAPGLFAGGGERPVMDRQRSERRNTVTSMAVQRGALWVGTLDGLCVSRDQGRTWQAYGRPHGLGAARVTAVGALAETVWAATTEGLFVSRDQGEHWSEARTRLRMGPDGREGFPLGLGWIEVGEGRRGVSVWLAGFDPPARRRGTLNLIRSEDAGSTWEAVGTGGEARAHSVHIAGTRLWACTPEGLALSTNFGDAWRKFGSLDGLPSDEVFAVLREGGRLWAATAEGVAHADLAGTSWTPLPGHHAPVRSLAVGRTGVWMAVRGGLLKRTHGGTWRTFAHRAEILSLAATSTAAGPAWWAGTHGGLGVSRDRGQTWRMLTVADGMPSNTVNALSPNEEGGVWAATDGGITHVGANLRLRAYVRRDGLHSLRIRDIAADGRHAWAATDRGLARFDAKRNVWRVHQADIPWRKVAASGPLVFGATTAWAEARPDALAPPLRPWPYHRGETFLVVGDPNHSSGEIWRHAPLPGHDGGPIHHLDASGPVVWASTNQGLYRSVDSAKTWAHYGEETLWGSVALQTFRAGRTEWGVFSYLRGLSPRFGGVSVTANDGRVWRSLPDRPMGEASAVAVSGGDLLCGTRDGLWVREGFAAALRDGRPGRLGWLRLVHAVRGEERPDLMGHVSAIDPYALHGPTLWLGSRGGGLAEAGYPVHDRDSRPLPAKGRSVSWQPHRRLSPENDPSALSGNHITALAPGPDRLWVGTANGLSAFDRADSWRSWFPEEGGLPAAPVTALEVMGDEVWVGTPKGARVYLPGEDRWTMPTAPTDLTSRLVTALRFSRGSLWAGTEGGLWRRGEGGEWAFHLEGTHVFDIHDGVSRTYAGTADGLFGLNAAGQVREHRSTRNSALLSDEIYRVILAGSEVWAVTPQGVQLVLRDGGKREAEFDARPSSAGPDGVVVVVNADVPGSVRVGERYAELRGIPPENIVRLHCPDEETVSREEFERTIRGPLRRRLAETGLGRRASFLATTYGVPLRIEESLPAADDMESDRATVDAELALLARPYALRGPLPNPCLNRDEPFDSTRFQMFLVSRLDGPTPEAAIGLAEKALRAERGRVFGARGFAYFDLDPERNQFDAGVDEAIMANYRFLGREEQMRRRLRLNPEPREFDQPNECPAAFFYLGWHSNIYRPRTFTWLDGAVGMHVHAYSARTLRRPEESWLAGALADGLAAGMGTVHQPGMLGVNAFENLARFLHAGYTWAEAAHMATRFLSWQNVVVGDPLYRPYP